MKHRVLSARSAVVAALMAVIAATLLACAQRGSQEKFQATDVTGVDWGRDFHLRDATGAARSSADYRGKVVMLFFGYTHCPDVCPTTLQKMAHAMDKLGADRERVQGLFVTLDPARDSPAVLAQYVPAFHPSFVGLTASEPTIAATAQDFKLYYAAQKPDARGSYTIDHMSATYVFDAQGRLRLVIGADVPVEAMVHDLNILLAQGPPSK